MGYERYPRNQSGEGYDRDRSGRDYGDRDYGNQFGSRDQGYYGVGGYGSGAAGGSYDRNRDFDRNREDYGSRDQYAQRDQFGPYGERGSYYSQRQYSQGDYGNQYGRSGGYDDDRGGFGRDNGRASYGRDYGRGQSYGRQSQGYDYNDRGFFNRAGDEVRSWFGDEDAERRRRLDERYDAQYQDDNNYHSWRQSQIDSLDRDYGEYRRESQQKFSNEFGAWRTDRQTQRSSLDRVTEHMDVVGSDGEHVGTVDKVRGDRILLTKNDADAGGRHHSIPSRWIDRVDSNVTLRKTADEAKAHWRDEERNSAFFGDAPGAGDADSDGRILNRSFSGTY